MDSQSLTANLHDKLRRIVLYHYADCRMQTALYAVFSYSHWFLVSRHSPVVARYHSRNAGPEVLILVVGKVDTINQTCQMLSFC